MSDRRRYIEEAQINEDLSELERIFDDDEQAEQINQRKETAVHEIAWMIRRDVPSVLAIDDASYPQPWTEDELVECLQKRNRIGIVVKDGDMIRGFAVYELQKERLALVRLAVDPYHRRQGCGTALIDRLKHKLAAQRRRELWADVPDNLDTCSFRFLASCGLRAVQMFRGKDGERDKYRFVYSIEQPSAAFHRD